MSTTTSELFVRDHVPNCGTRKWSQTGNSSLLAPRRPRLQLQGYWGSWNLWSRISERKSYADRKLQVSRYRFPLLPWPITSSKYVCMYITLYVCCTYSVWETMKPTKSCEPKGYFRAYVVQGNIRVPPSHRQAALWKLQLFSCTLERTGHRSSIHALQ